MNDKKSEGSVRLSIVGAIMLLIISILIIILSILQQNGIAQGQNNSNDKFSPS